jgi:hypothetical protein
MNKEQNPVGQPSHELINDPTRKIIFALENPAFTWRTIEGVSRDTEIPPEEVSNVLENLGESGQVIETTRKDFGIIYTTRKHYTETEPVFNRILSVLSGRIR